MSASVHRSKSLVRRVRHAAVAAAVLSMLGVGAGTAFAQVDNGFAPGRILVMPRAGLPEAALAKILNEHGAGKARRIGKSALRIVDLPPGQERQAVERLARHPHVKFAELDKLVKPSLSANDPYIGSAWQMPVLKAPAAWDVSQGSGVTIAILDSGVLATHEDLSVNIVSGYNSFDGSSATSDVQGHGTAVAGAAAAATDNGRGVAGIAGRAKIMPIRITDAAGNAFYSTIATGITYAADRGVRVVNCSYGPLFNVSSIQSAGAYLKNKGGLLVVSAGNNGVNENASATSSMIVVSATDSSDALAGWSSYGPMVSVAAPGVGIWTTSWDGTYRAASGTSFAAPTVAGVVALIMAANPALGASQVESVLYASALDLGAAGRDIYYGYGRVDASAAVQAASGAVATDTQAPSVAIGAPTAGASVSGLVTVDVSASDNIGVNRVELRVNGALLATETAAPYRFSWDSTTLPNGSVTLTAVAVDAAGNSATSRGASVSVANAVALDTTPPSVSFGSPADGASLSGNVSVVVNASDNSGAATLRQSLYLDNVLVASGTGAKLSYQWNTRKSSLGGHEFKAVAQDAAGNLSSRTIRVTRKK